MVHMLLKEYKVSGVYRSKDAKVDMVTKENRVDKV